MVNVFKRHKCKRLNFTKKTTFYISPPPLLLPVTPPLPPPYVNDPLLLPSLISTCCLQLRWLQSHNIASNHWYIILIMLSAASLRLLFTFSRQDEKASRRYCCLHWYAPEVSLIGLFIDLFWSGRLCCFIEWLCAASVKTGWAGLIVDVNQTKDNT